MALLVFDTGAGLSLYEGIQHLWHPARIEHALMNYIVLAIAMLLEGAPWLAAYRQFSHMRGQRGTVEAVQRAKDPTVSAVLFEDSAALAGKADSRVKRVFIESQNTCDPNSGTEPERRQRRG